MNKECPKCAAELLIRNGKFGEFICCPKGHGTFSIQGDQMYYKGDVGKMFAKERLEEKLEAMCRAGVYRVGTERPTLSALIHSQVNRFGWNPSGDMESLSEYMLSDPETCYDDEELHSGDHWWNERHC